MKDFYPGEDAGFRFITLKEPLKAEMIPFLDQEHQGLPPSSRPARVARVQVVVLKRNQRHPTELFVNLDSSTIEKEEQLVGRHSYIDAEYMLEVEKACMADKRIRVEIKKLDLPAEATVVIEPWAYAPDGMNDMRERITMVRLSAR